MSLLNKYILKKILSKYLFLLIGFLILFLIIDIIENINKFIDSNISTNQMLYYYIYSIPWFISIALPMTTLLSCIFTIGELQKHHELTAIKASGISLKKLSFVFIILGIVISISSFVFDNTLVSSSIKKRAEIEKKYLTKKETSNQQIKRFHLVNDKNDLKEILYISNYDFITRKSRNVTIKKIQKSSENIKLIETIDIKSFAWDEQSSSWLCSEINKRKFPDFKNEHLSQEMLSISIYGPKNKKKTFKEEDLIKFLPDSEELNYWELKALSDRRPDDIRLKVDYNFKIAFSCTSLIMILFAIGLSIKRPRSNYATGIGIGIMVIFMYYIGMKFGQSLGYNKILSPFISVWMVNAIFLFIGGWLYARIRT